MAERQKGHLVVVFIGPQFGRKAFHHRAQIPVREHRPLGLAGGARGVDQDGQITLASRGEPAFELLRVGPIEFLAARLVGREAHHHRIIETLEAFHFKDHDPHQARQPLAYLEHLVELLIVFHEQHTRTGIGAQILHLRGRIGGIDAA